MEEKKNEVYGQSVFHRSIISRFGTPNYKSISYSLFFIVALGITSNLIGHYWGVEYNVGLLVAAIILFIQTARIKLVSRHIYSCLFNLSLSVLAGASFFILREKIQDYIIIFILLIVVYIFVALSLVAKDAIAKKDKKVGSLTELINVCLQSEGFGLILILSFWFIFFVMLQSFFLAMGSSMSTSALALPEGAIVSSIFSFIIIFTAVILATRRVKKRLSTMLLFFVVLAASIWSWIITATIIFAIELRLV
ncbi:MAG: hypothetical protein PHI66_04895 [Candidatus Pacebacteria bacterium]|nr:hypothetical protein [Candidatus Paceibacterota bacterium]